MLLENLALYGMHLKFNTRFTGMRGVVKRPIQHEVQLSALRYSLYLYYLYCTKHIVWPRILIKILLNDDIIVVLVHPVMES